jgi:hypothetical protein
MIPRFAYLLIIASIFALPHAGHAAALPVCGQDQLSLGFDSENGNFDGMSHSGTLLVLRNLGPKPCQLPAFPKLSFEDSTKHILNIATHPAGTKRPPRLAVGAEATAALRWVSSPVFTNSVCLKTASLSVSWSGGKLTQALAASICGPSSGPVTITQSPLATDPAAPHG